MEREPLDGRKLYADLKKLLGIDVPGVRRLKLEIGMDDLVTLQLDCLAFENGEHVEVTQKYRIEPITDVINTTTLESQCETFEAVNA